ncbi:hypothetical protein BDN70DRAFT_905253 [Pholiota conissans]|uniref:F-box domain-containing protein n=1 Tax=Pholiota conissans TaxID=109636 RepID=A0A9P6CW55_9AGAR|nr:hypothetical protein BDN70DRAFT_905253 [Pholiota conissans]
MIFSFLDPRSNAANAQVCKSWHNVALDGLWKDVECPSRLFDLLAPLKETREDTFEFERPPDADDWKRFDKYALRVRRLQYLGCARHILHQSVFDTIARTRRRLEILPNLRDLQWSDDNVEFSILFMHSGIKDFAVHLPLNMMKNSPRPFFQDLADRMPNLINLDIRSQVPVCDIEAEMIELLNMLPKLRKITFPRFYVTKGIAEALSRMEYLSVIEFQYKEEQGCGDSVDVASVKPIFTEGAFPALYDLSLTVYFDDAAHFINTSFSPANLTIIYIASETAIEPPENIKTLLSVMAENCQLLTYVALISVRDTSITEIEGSSSHIITLDTLKPLLKLPNLESFEIVHQYPISFSQEDLELFASSCPSIETLLLNTEPVYLTRSTLTLESLIPFAKHCPRLNSLGLFLDATAEIPELSILTPPKPFVNLSKLSMGVSIIEDDSAPSLYLSQLLPPTTEIDCGITWDNDGQGNETLSNIVKERCHVWDRVAETVPLLSTLRRQERQRMLAMERELEDLRMRKAVLRDTVTMGVKMDISTCVLI